MRINNNAHLLSKEELYENFYYDPEAGHLWWKNNKYGRDTTKPIQRMSKSKTSASYSIYWKRKNLKVHRVIWFYMTGKWPDAEIDHINGDPTDNRWCNLREATKAQNMQNKKPQKNSVVGIPGVQWERNRKHWVARITVDKKHRYLGSFHNIEEAIVARREAEKKYFGSFAYNERPA